MQNEACMFHKNCDFERDVVDCPDRCLQFRGNTNLDRIKAKSAREFASMLLEGEFPSSLDYGITFCDMCAKDGNTMNFTCVDCLTYWLEQPYKEEQHGI